MEAASTPRESPRRIALGVSGGIACYKAAEILRRLQDRGYEVVVLMTRNARRFVTPLTFGALSGNKVYSGMFEGEDGSDFEGAFDHIFVADSIDLFLVAPATADCIARMATGQADDFLTTFHLAVTASTVVAPAMNTRMWRHPAVQANVGVLARRGVHIIDPDTGEMACGTQGPGRLAEVGRIVDYVDKIASGSADLEGRKFLVTAGPTIEDIDPVRFISNRSTGKMGFALAEAASQRGGDVVLVSGPTEMDFPGVIRVRTTAEMRQAVLDNLAGVDAVIKAAAPLDFQPSEVQVHKIKKSDGIDLRFEPTPDILHELGQAKNGMVLVGFAAETENHIAFGMEKLRSKNLDLVVVNDVGGPNSAFNSDTNQASILDAGGAEENLPRMSKLELANRILDRIKSLL